MPIYQNLYQTLLPCPIVELRGYLAACGLRGRLYAYLNYNGPTGTARDNLAEGMLALADERGALKPGQPVIEASSGAFALALTLAGQTAGHPVVLTMPEDAPALRQEQLLRLGARILHVPARGGLSAARALARQTAAEKGWYDMNWLANDDNPTFHRRVTGPAIVKSIAREGASIVDSVTIGGGSAGTITGVGETIKAWTNDAHIVGPGLDGLTHARYGAAAAHADHNGIHGAPALTGDVLHDGRAGDAAVVFGVIIIGKVVGKVTVIAGGGVFGNLFQRTAAAAAAYHNARPQVLQMLPAGKRQAAGHHQDAGVACGGAAYRKGGAKAAGTGFHHRHTGLQCTALGGKSQHGFGHAVLAGAGSAAEIQICQYAGSKFVPPGIPRKPHHRGTVHALIIALQYCHSLADLLAKIRQGRTRSP